ncbi:MAG: PRC-barrel domain-containing protein [Rubrobacteraceae bacterium]|nr:PRC-barrel domain-containing protein [Rubrobacteraceae bacterium]
MEGRGLVGLEARAADGTEIGRISGVITDEESGEVTHVLVEMEEGEEVEIPISALTLDPEADFATFHADPSDGEPGDHLEDGVGVATEIPGSNATPTSEVEPEGYAPAESDAPDDSEHEGQFVTTPLDPAEATPPEDLVKESGEAGDWQDEGSTPDSGYPRNDAYVDPDTGEEDVDPFLEDNETLKDDVEDLINDTDLEARSVNGGVVELSGSAATRQDLEEIVQEIMGLDGVLDVDTTDVDVG